MWWNYYAQSTKRLKIQRILEHTHAEAYALYRRKNEKGKPISLFNEFC